MNRLRMAKTLRHSLLPVATFMSVLAAHYLWMRFFSPPTRWLSIGGTGNVSWLRRYAETQSYWLGLSYALSLAFASACLRRYREEHFCQAQRFAVGGLTFSGTLAVAGCYLLGCCGSPMLAVYLGLFGAAFLPFSKPLVFSFTAVCVAVAWWWLNRGGKSGVSRSTQACCEDRKV